VGLAIPILATWLILVQERKDHLLRLEERASSESLVLANGLSRALVDLRRLLLVEAREPVYASGLAHPGKGFPDLEEALRAFSITTGSVFERIRILDAAGNPVAAFTGYGLPEADLGRPLPPEEASFLRTALLDPGSRTLLGPVLGRIESSGSQPQAALLMAAPIRDRKGPILGLMVVEAHLRRSTLLEVPMETWGIADEQGQVLLPPQEGPSWMARVGGLPAPASIQRFGTAGKGIHRLFFRPQEVDPGRSWILFEGLDPAAARQFSMAGMLAILTIWISSLGFLFILWRALLRRRTASEREAQQRLLKAVMDAATEISIIATEPTGTIRLFNRGAERLLGLPASEVVRRMSPLSFHDPEEVEARSRELGAALGRPVQGFEVLTLLPSQGLGETRTWTYVRADGRRFPASLSVNALKDGEGRIFGYLGVAQDIHLQRDRERSLENTAREAQEAARLKSAFLATMSHEIRTPMNAIMAMARYLLSTDLDPEQREITEIGRKAAQNLLSMLDGVLDLSKAESGMLSLESLPFSPVTLTRDCAELWRADATAKGLDFLVALPSDTPPGLGDPLRIKQVLNNLLGNALKFTPSGSITLRLGVHEDDTHLRLHWAVEDTGIGMTPEAAERVFHPFSQADAGITRQFGGTGLGLSLSREIVQRMDGRLSAQSLPGQGSTFTAEIRVPKA